MIQWRWQDTRRLRRQQQGSTSKARPCEKAEWRGCAAQSSASRPLLALVDLVTDLRGAVRDEDGRVRDASRHFAAGVSALERREEDALDERWLWEAEAGRDVARHAEVRILCAGPRALASGCQSATGISECSCPIWIERRASACRRSATHFTGEIRAGAVAPSTGSAERAATAEAAHLVDRARHQAVDACVGAEHVREDGGAAGRGLDGGEGELPDARVVRHAENVLHLIHVDLHAPVCLLS